MGFYLILPVPSGAVIARSVPLKKVLNCRSCLGTKVIRRFGLKGGVFNFAERRISRVTKAPGSFPLLHPCFAGMIDALKYTA